MDSGLAICSIVYEIMRKCWVSHTSSIVRVLTLTARITLFWPTTDVGDVQAMSEDLHTMYADQDSRTCFMGRDELETWCSCPFHGVSD
jgi:hypothetical protein